MSCAPTHPWKLVRDEMPSAALGAIRKPLKMPSVPTLTLVGHDDGSDHHGDRGQGDEQMHRPRPYAPTYIWPRPGTTDHPVAASFDFQWSPWASAASAESGEPGYSRRSCAKASFPDLRGRPAASVDR